MKGFKKKNQLPCFKKYKPSLCKVWRTNADFTTNETELFDQSRKWASVHLTSVRKNAWAQFGTTRFSVKKAPGAA